MRVSVITTFLNEEISLKRFFLSLFSQSLSPSEIIIVDGGSTDNSLAIIEKMRSKSLFRDKIRILKKKGNRSVGRNTAIRNARGSVIAVSDAGCLLDKNWLKNITDPFKDKKIMAVSGFYKPRAKTIFQKCLAAYTCTMPDKVDPLKFLPSSRSVAFRKVVWKRVGGYPEQLNTCEDLVFDERLIKAGYKFKFVKRAVVYWPQRDNILQAFKQFLNYAIGDGQALFIRPQTPLLFARYIVGFFLVILAFVMNSNYLFAITYLLITAYILWAISKNYKYVLHPLAVFYLPLLQIVSDISVILGMSFGVLKRLI